MNSTNKLRELEADPPTVGGASNRSQALANMLPAAL